MGEGPEKGIPSEAAAKVMGCPSARSVSRTFSRNKGFLFLLLFCLLNLLLMSVSNHFVPGSKFLLIFNHFLIQFFHISFHFHPKYHYYNLGFHHFTIGQL